MSKLSLVCPALAAAFPLLLLSAQNLSEVPLSFVVPVLLVALGGSIVLNLLLRLLLRDHAKAGLLATLWVLMFFFYGRMYDIVYGMGVAGFVVGRHRYLAPLMLAVAILPLFVRLPHRKVSHRLTQWVAIALAVPVVFNLSAIALYQMRPAAPPPTHLGDADVLVPRPSTLEDMPDIYYIILDRHASFSTLKEYFGYDNTGFLDFLRENGFYVATESLANYPSTYLSLASSLNMEYLDDLSQAVGKEPAYQMIQNNRVSLILKQWGYKFINLGTWWEPTRYNPNADMNVNFSRKVFGLFELDELSLRLLETTMLYPFLPSPGVDIASWQKESMLYKFEMLERMPAVESPKFVFAHFLTPHHPYIFSRDGKVLNPIPASWYGNPSISREKKELLKSRYLEQLLFTDKIVGRAIKRILAESRQPPIIILQSDEGPTNPAFVDPGLRDNPYVSRDYLRLHMRILNAYYLPRSEGKTLYDFISPVNTFRVIFNEYFETGLPLLEDRAYIGNSSEQEYSFTDVTGKVR